MALTFVEVPRQRNSREENAGIKAGQPPEQWKEEPNKLRQKDVDARWTKKNDEQHYGYKNHVNADEANKLVQSCAVSDAAVHDSQVFEELLVSGSMPMVRSVRSMPTAHTALKTAKRSWWLMDLKARSMKKARLVIH